jgi:hypothetical protein
MPKGQLALKGAATFERRGSLIRVDLLTLSLTDATKATPLPDPIPPGGYSVVYDTVTMVYTVWSPSRRTYYSGKGRPAMPSPPATPTPAPSASPGSSLESALASLKDLRQFAISLSLAADKTPIDGHPTTNFDFRFTRQVKAQDPIDASGRASFADDLGGVPLLLVLSATHGPAGTLGANLRVSLSDVKQKAPPESDFAPPAGYAKGSSIFDVIVIPVIPVGSSPSP